jgi:predicted phage-related endonuclease
MAITAEQRANRKNHLGSSDIPAILGFSRFANAYDVWLLKTGRVEEKEKKQDYITAGNLLEQPIIEWCSSHLGQRIVTEGVLLERRVQDTPIVTHMDGFVDAGEGEPVECKSEGVDHPIIEPWGETGTDEVPEYTFIQAHCHLMATDTELCHVPTFLGGRGFGYFFVQRDNAIVDLIRREAVRFWEENVLKDVPPENVAPTLAMAKRIRHVEGDVVALDPAVIESWVKAKEDAKAAKKMVEFHQAEILASLDGVDMGTCELGDITNFEQNRMGYTVEPTSFRVLRLKKRKEHVLPQAQLG